MISKDLLKYSLQALWKRKLRSFLTVVSIFIGITAIFILVSFGQGLSVYVAEIAEKMGTDKIIVQPRGFGFGPPALDSNVVLDKQDVDFLEDISGVEEATGVYILSGEIEFDDQIKYAYVFGSDFKDHRKLIEEVYALSIEEGRDLKGKEKSKVLLGYGYTLDDKIFPKRVTVGDKILINGVDFKVTGFYEEVGNPIDDANIYLTDVAAEEIFDADTYPFVLVRSKPGKDPAQLAETLKKKFRKHRGQSAGQEDFQVQTFEQLIETFNSVLAIINTVLILIALISIFVAAVNIMNTMYTSVLERTGEIGVMKAIGARNRDILFIFVLESGLLGIFGGALGVLVGYGLAVYAGNVVAQAGFSVLQPVFTLPLILGCLLFSLFIGAISGVMPAYRASKLNPVDALQYE